MFGEHFVFVVEILFVAGFGTKRLGTDSGNSSLKKRNMKAKLTIGIGLVLLASACGNKEEKKMEIKKEDPKKVVLYQVFTRLFGNTNETNKPWGTIEENGVGKFNDFTDKALQEIKDLGVTHIWYTGVPHHALVNDYTEFGISNDDPEVVKGRAALCGEGLL